MANPSFVEFKNATLKIIDGSGTPKELTLELGQGEFTYTENYNITPRLRRGRLWAMKKGDEQPVEVSFQADLDAVTGTGTSPTISEALKGTGVAASEGWTTVGGSCEPYATDIEVTIPNSDCDATVQDEVYTFPEFRVTNVQVNMNEATISFQGICNIESITPTRPAL